MSKPLAIRTQTLLLWIVLAAFPSPTFAQNETSTPALQKSKDSPFAYGSHPILKQDIAALQLKIDRTKVEDYARPTPHRPRPRIDQNLGVEYVLSPADFLDLTQEIELRALRQDNLFDESADPEGLHSQLWENENRTTLSLQPLSKLRLQAYAENVTSWIDNNPEAENLERIGAGFTLSLAPSTRLIPEWRSEEFENSQNKITLRDRRSLTIEHDLSKNLKLSLKPALGEDDAPFASGKDEQLESWDGGILWKFCQGTDFKMGVRKAERYADEIERDLITETLYSAIDHDIASWWDLRVSGRFDQIEDDRPNRDLDKAWSRWDLSVSNDFKITDNMSAGAELRYLSDPNATRGEGNEEKILGLSVKGRF